MAHIRVIETIIGSKVAVLIAAFVVPVRARSRVREPLVHAVQAVGQIATVSAAGTALDFVDLVALEEVRRI